MRRTKLNACVAIAALLLFTAGSAAAQEFRATIRGQVLDSSNAALPGATVSAKNDETGEIGGIEPAVAFGDVARRASYRIRELTTFLQVRRQRSHFTDRVDGLLVRDTRLPSAELRESSDATHASPKSRADARQKGRHLRQFR